MAEAKRFRDKIKEKIKDRAIVIGWLGFAVALSCIIGLWYLNGSVPDFPTPFLEVFLGAMISVWANVYFEALKKPVLSIELWGDGKPHKMFFNSRSGVALHLQVVNKPLRKGFEKLGLVREKALDASGYITFRDMEGRARCPSRRVEAGKGVTVKLRIRWTNTLQPYQLLWVKRPEDRDLLRWEVTDPERLTVLCAIGTGFAEGLAGGVSDGVFDVALKEDDQNSFYAISNECYWTDWRPPDWLLVAPDSLLDIEIHASNATCGDVFHLHLGDRVSSEAIYLETVPDATKKKVWREKAREESERAREQRENKIP